MSFTIYCIYVNSYSFALTHCSSDLSEPVDVYSDWIDACEAANQ